MYRYKDLVVALGLDARDETLVRYAELVAFMARSEHVQFVHVYPDASVFREMYPEDLRPLPDPVEGFREHLAATVERFEGPTGTSVEPALVQGGPLMELLRMAKAEDADLVMAGRDAGGGTLAEKLCRKAPCSVMVVPPDGPGSIERVVVPIDLSGPAADAADVAVAFAEAARLEEVHFLHVYTIPPSYLKLGRDRAEAAEAMRRHASERLEAFVGDLSLRGLRPVFHVAEGDDVADTIVDQATAVGADLVVIGTRGRSAAAAVLMGSVAERVVRQAPVPVVAVKRKGATLGLLDALFEL
ncbi:MAG: universal stress protein [Bacteroidota bacterium]